MIVLNKILVIFVQDLNLFTCYYNLVSLKIIIASMTMKLFIFYSKKHKLAFNVIVNVLYYLLYFHLIDLNFMTWETLYQKNCSKSKD